MDGGKFDDDDLKSAQKTGRKTADKPPKRQKSKNAHVASQTGGGDNGEVRLARKDRCDCKQHDLERQG